MARFKAGDLAVFKRGLVPMQVYPMDNGDFGDYATTEMVERYSGKVLIVLNIRHSYFTCTNLDGEPQGYGFSDTMFYHLIGRKIKKEKEED